jgi:hypothetical protein
LLFFCLACPAGLWTIAAHWRWISGGEIPMMLFVSLERLRRARGFFIILWISSLADCPRGRGCFANFPSMLLSDSNCRLNLHSKHKTDKIIQIHPSITNYHWFAHSFDDSDYPMIVGECEWIKCNIKYTFVQYIWCFGNNNSSVLCCSWASSTINRWLLNGREHILDLHHLNTIFNISRMFMKGIIMISFCIIKRMCSCYPFKRRQGRM